MREVAPGGARLLLPANVVANVAAARAARALAAGHLRFSGRFRAAPFFFVASPLRRTLATPAPALRRSSVSW
mgnify:CR=1 FL=1